MGNWFFNDIDITQKFGLSLKKGAYNGIFRLCETKDYLYEDTREQDGSKAYLKDPRFKYRDIDVGFYLCAESTDDFWTKYNDLVSFLHSVSWIDFFLKKHNRNYRVIYLSCSNLNALKKNYDGAVYVEITLSFREVNPYNVSERHLLISEDGECINTENGEELIVNKNIY